MIHSKLVFAAVLFTLYIVSVLALRHFYATNESKILEGVDTFYREREAIDNNLRSQIVNLQKKMVNLPKIFNKNNKLILQEVLRKSYVIETTDKISGADEIAQLFSRDERKELFAGRIIAQIKNNKLFYAIGLLDDNGEFTGVVERNQLQSKNIGVDFEKLNATINSDVSVENAKINYEEKIALLKQICIDSAFDAEKTRIEFVTNDRDVAKIKRKFVEESMDYNKKELSVAVMVLGGNILCAVLLAVFLFRLEFFSKTDGQNAASSLRK